MRPDNFLPGTKRICSVLLILLTIAIGDVYGQSTCSTPSTIAGFEVDGDIKANTMSPTSGDSWFLFPSNPGSGIGVIGTTAATATPAISASQFNSIVQSASNVVNRNRTYLQRMSVPYLTQSNGQLLIDAFGVRDFISTGGALDSSVFTAGGQKNGDNPGVWTIGTGSVQQKNDIIDVGGHLRRQMSARLSSGAVNDLWMLAYITTLSTSGDRYSDIELFRTQPYINPTTNTFMNTGPAATGGHTAFQFDNAANVLAPGDLLISVNYSLSGGLASVRIWCNINDLDGNGNGLAWFNAQPNRPFNLTGDFITGTGSNGYGYAEISSLSGATCLVYSVLNTATTNSGAWGNLSGSGAAYDSNIQAGQLVNIAINLSDFGLDNSSISGPCFNVFGSIIIKTRSSSSWSSELKDFTGPLTFANFSEVNADAGPDQFITCNNFTPSLQGSTLTPGATYSWSTSNGNIVSGANTLNPVVNAPGTYILSVQNPTFSTCVATDTVVVAYSNSAPNANAGTDKELSCSVLTVSLNGSSSTSGVSYSWTAINGGSIVGGANTATPVVNAAGCYVLTVTNQFSGCTATDTACVTLNNGTPVISGISMSNVSCYGGCNGALSVSATGGQSPYSYQWSNTSTTSSLSALCAGTYTVTVTGANGCSSQQPFTITQPSQALAGSVSSTQSVSCFGGANGVAVVSANGGTQPYSYLWNNGSTSATVNGLTAGTYSVTVTDANGCTWAGSVSVTQPATAVTSTLVVTQQVSCFGGANGSLDLTPAGGVAPYTYQWSHGAMTQDVTGLSAGTYTVTVTDGNGCSTSQSKVITQPSAALAASASMTQSVSCFGGNNGTASVAVTGGTPAYTYVWSSGANTQSAGGLSSGTYTVTVTDANGCTANSSVSVSQPSAALTTSLTSSQQVSCFGGTNGSINLTVSGGTTPYTYLWSNGSAIQDISNLTAGTYSVTVTDARGCTASRSVTITQPAAALSAAASMTQSVGCFGGNTGTATVTVSGGTTPYLYQWSNGATSQSVSALAAGTYTVTVTDGNGCVASSSVTITQPSASLASTLTVSQTVACFGGTNGIITNSVSGGTTPYTYLWSNGATTQGLSGVGSGTYTVTITDNRGCTVVRSAVMTQPSAALSGSITPFTNISCFGANDGYANLSVSGGTAPYTYLWSNGSTTQDISGLIAGTYSATVTDNRGCTIALSITLTQPSAALTAVITSSVNVSCNAGSNGSVNLTVTGGTAPYTYIWSNGSTTQDLSGLGAGTYTVTVTDTKGCIANQSVTITQPAAALAASAVVTSNVNCFNGTNGSVNLTVTGGTSPYTYLWSNGSTGEDPSGLGSGTYSVTVTDANGCTATASVSVSQPSAALSSSIALTQAVSCFGGSDASVNLTVSGGTSPYSYLWSNGSTTQDISGVPAGNYNVTITDANGCTTASGITVTQPSAALSAVITSSVNVNCFAGYTGSVNLTVTGGTAPYTYSWSNGSAAQDLSGLAAGTYSVVVTDNKGCTAAASVTITQPVAALSATTTVQSNVNCFGGNNGAINLSVSGGTAPYVYSWSNGSSTQNLSGLGAGTYTVTITDNKGCTAISTASVSQPSAALNASAVLSQAVSCFGGSDAVINLTVSGGTSPYSYLWSNGATIQDIFGLSAGVYSVTVTDAQGCTAAVSITVTQPSAGLSASTTTTSNISCFAGANGSVDLTVNGGTTPYTYNWSNGATTQDLTGLPAGSYSVSITDANGCTVSSAAVITQPPGSLGANIVITQQVACYGGGNGAVDLTVSGGTPPYTINWSNGATTEDLSGLAVGVYTVNISDANGCITSATASITQPSAPLTSTLAVVSNVSCFGGNDGTLNLSVSGGTIPYSYLWNNGATTQDISNVGSGTFTVTITDANGCTNQQSATVTQPAAALNASITSSVNVLCHAGANGSVNLTVTGGTAPYTYSWSNGSTTQDLSGLSGGTYQVTVTDSKGCNTNATVTITEPSASLSAQVASQVNVACYGNASGSIALTVTGGTTPYTYLWSNGATGSGLSGIGAGSYQVTVTDANGCTASASATITQPNAALSVSASATQQVSCFSGSDGQVSLTVAGGTPSYTYSWSNGASSQNISNLSAGTYSVTVTDNNGCTATSSVTITQPSATVVASITGSINVLCHGGANGSVDLTVTGGTTPYNYNWNTGATTQDLSGLSGGVYSVTVTDANGCNSNASVTINEPSAPLYASVSSQVSVLCFGHATGSVNLTVSGGTAPYTYSWSNGSTTSDLNAIPAGNYQVTVTDANACTATAAAIITQPAAALSATSSVLQNVSCFSGNDGQVDVTVTGGTAPYTYNWNNGSTSQDLQGIPAGTYTVTVTDANGCTAVQTATVTEPSATVTGTATITSNVNCFGGNNAGIDVSASGGTQPYTFLWSNGASSEDLSGLTAGVYTVTVTDMNGCSVVLTSTITEPSAALTATASVTQQVLCFAGNTGIIDLSVSGGTSPYSFNWSNGAASEDLSGLTTGTYTVSITDANGCTASAIAFVAEPRFELEITVNTVLPVLCNAGNDGSIDVTVSGGTPLYTFNWSNGASSEDLANLSAGVYALTVTDANGCTDTVTVTITEPAASLAAALTVTQQVNCFAGEDGAIDLTVTGGTTPYTFAWNNGATTEDINQLMAGTYAVTVTDANGCSTQGQIDIIEPSAPLIGIPVITSNVFCNGGSNGSIDLNVSGGTAPYTFIWSTGATSEDISGLSSGVYTVTITDANGCTNTASAGIGQPSQQLSATMIIQNVLCFNGTNGFIDITTTGGTAPYSYVWSNGAVTEDLGGLIAGTFTVTITDVNGCDTTLTGSVTQPQAPLIPSVTVGQDVSCFGGSDGALVLSVTGGTTPYVYLWNTGATTQNINNLPAGMYTVTVTDANGCNAIITQSVSQPAASLTAALTVTQNVSCHSGNDGAVIANATGGTVPYAYLWSTGATTNAVSGLSTGTYTVTVTDANGCTFTDAIQVSQPANPVAVTGTTTLADCLYGIGGTATATATGGTQPYSYVWNTGATGNTLVNAAPATYTVTVTDANGCSQSINLTVGNQSDVVMQTGPTEICVGQTTTLAVDSIPGATYQWYYSGIALPGATANTFETPAQGHYFVTVTTPCGSFTSDTVTVTVHAVTGASISNNQVICPPESVQLVATGGMTYQWTPTTNINFANIPNPTVSPEISTTYTVVVTNEYGCTTSMSVEVTVACDSLFIPNGFSPNDDGINDGYVIDGILDYPNNRIWIYNRWGNLIYKTKGYANQWDGICNVQGIYFGKKVPQGTYYFILDLGDPAEKPRAGYLIIRR